LRSYANGIKCLFSFLRENGVDDFHLLNRELLEHWQDSMRERVPPLRASTRSVYGTGVRRLIKWAAERGIVEADLERAVKGISRRLKKGAPGERPISKDDLARLMDYLGSRHSRPSTIALRDRALFYFLLETGLQVTEAVQLTRANFEAGHVRMRDGAFVEFAVSATVTRFIREYLRARTDDLPWLWAKHGNNSNVVIGRLDKQGVRQIWERISFKLKIERFSSRRLRRTTGAVLFDQGVAGHDVARHLRLADPRSIRRYPVVKVAMGASKQPLEVMEHLIHFATIDNSESRDWWFIDDGRVVLVEGYRSGPETWWFPSSGMVAREGHDLFASEGEARVAAIRLLESERESIDRKLEALEIESVFAGKVAAEMISESDGALAEVGIGFARSLLREASPAARRTYKKGVDNLFAFLRQNGVDDFHLVTNELLEAWQASMHNRPLKPGTRSVYGTAVRRLIKWAAERRIVDRNLWRAVKGVPRGGWVPRLVAGPTP
jgi:site-specific recombinase XerD